MPTPAAAYPTPPPLAAVLARRKPLVNPHKFVAERLTRLQRVAVWITDHVGSMGFFLLIAGWTFLWLSWNLLAPAALQFDPPMAFVFWLFISNVMQILLMPLIMVGQNVQSQASDKRAEETYKDAEAVLHESIQIQSHLEAQDFLLSKLLTQIAELEAKIERGHSAAAV